MAKTLRVPESLEEQVRAQAEQEGISVNSLYVKAAQEYVDRHCKRALIDDAVAKIKIDYADALRRLGE